MSKNIVFYKEVLHVAANLIERLQQEKLELLEEVEALKRISEDTLEEFATTLSKVTQENLKLLAAIAKKDEALNFAAKIISDIESSIDGDTESVPVVIEALAIQPDATALSEYVEPLVKALENMLDAFTGKLHEFSALQQERAEIFARATLAAFKGEQK